MCDPIKNGLRENAGHFMGRFERLQLDFPGKLKPSIGIVHNKVCCVFVQNEFDVGETKTVESGIGFCRSDVPVMDLYRSGCVPDGKKKLCLSTAET